MAGRAVIGGLVIDAMLVGAIAAFGWAGIQLGGRTSLRRTIASWIAIAVAAALRDPIGDAVASMFGWSDEFARLAGIVVVGIGTYAAASNVLSWVLRRRTPDFEDEEEVFERADRIDGRRVAAVAGTLLGVPWALILVGTIVLLPTDSVVTRSAVASWSGGGLIREGHVLRWMERGFPRYTQTLPKGRRGVVVGERARLPMRGAESCSRR